MPKKLSEEVFNYIHEELRGIFSIQKEIEKALNRKGSVFSDDVLRLNRELIVKVNQLTDKVVMEWIKN